MNPVTSAMNALTCAGDASPPPTKLCHVHQLWHSMRGVETNLASEFSNPDGLLESVVEFLEVVDKLLGRGTIPMHGNSIKLPRVINILFDVGRRAHIPCMSHRIG